ncbi:MAG TPA: TIGR03086 family metal-binding protein [Acidimicrobiales bacterium]|nr:TIGR03086 family metal-binding protein [Acidimicrobiales bacterium]
MMDALNSLHRRALDATGKIVSGIGPGRWRRPTPCEGWDVRALTTHIVAGNLWAVELVGGRTIEEVGNRLDGDVLGSDPSAAYERSAAAAAEAFDVPGALDAPCAVSYGPVPGAVHAGHRPSSSTTTRRCST